MMDIPGKSQIRKSLADVCRFIGVICIVLFVILHWVGNIFRSQNQLGVFAAFRQGA